MSNFYGIEELFAGKENELRGHKTQNFFHNYCLLQSFTMCNHAIRNCKGSCYLL